MVNAGSAHSPASAQVCYLAPSVCTGRRISENAQKAAPEAGQGRDTDSLHNRGEGSQARQTGPTNTSSKDTLAGEGSGATSGGDSSAYAQPAQVGTSAENAHSLSSDTHSSTGQDPPPPFPTQSDLSATSEQPTTMTGTAISIASLPEKSPAEANGTLREKDKDKDSYATTVTSPLGKRRRDGQSVSEGGITSSSLTHLPSLPEDSKSPSKRAKKSLFSKFTLLCKSCIASQHTHLDLDEGASPFPDSEKQTLKDAEAAHHGTQSSSSTTGTYLT